MPTDAAPPITAAPTAAAVIVVPAPMTAAPAPAAPTEVVPSGPPALQVVAGGTSVPTVFTGSLWWRGRGPALKGDGARAPTALRAAGIVPTAVAPGDRLRLVWAPAPTWISVHRWLGDDATSGATEPVRLEPDGALVVPRQPGTYVYEVTAEWERTAYEGRAMYGFHVRVP